MKQKQHSTAEIIRILRQVESGRTVEDLCRDHNIPKATFHRWRKKYGDMDLADARRLKELEKENTELKTDRITYFGPFRLRRFGLR